MKRIAEFNDRSQRTGLAVDLLRSIDAECGLLMGALANQVCQRGHQLSNHPTPKHRER